MSRLLAVVMGRLPRAALGLVAGAGVLAAVVAGAGGSGRAASPLPPVHQASAGTAIDDASAGVIRQAEPAVRAGTGGPAATACPFQQIAISQGSAAPLPTCLDATRVQQNGGIRSYLAAGSGAAAWALQVDVAGGEVVQALLRAADGRLFACEAADCGGLRLGRHDARGLRSITLAAVSLLPQSSKADGDPALAAPLRVSGRIAVPADDLLPDLACTGPSVLLGSPDGSQQKFCGQGGAGVELADDGSRIYRFDDAEGHTLAVSVDAGQRVAGVRYGALSCSGTGCTGASMTAQAPESELSERSFFFGRTPLYAERDPRGASGGPARPQMLLEGSLTLPSQE